MTTATLSIAHLEELLAFAKKKLSLSLDLEKIEKEIASFFGGGKPAPKAPGKRGRPAKKSTMKAPRGTLKAQILEVLTEAGKSGMSIGDVAERTGAKKSSLNTWFYTTGKKAGVTKVARGRFALFGKTPDAAPVEPSAPKRKPRATRTSGKIPRGTLKPAILAALADAPKDGLSVAQVAEKIGVNHKNVGVWFYTTGKKTKELKKVGRGRFALEG